MQNKSDTTDAEHEKEDIGLIFQNNVLKFLRKWTLSLKYASNPFINLKVFLIVSISEAKPIGISSILLKMSFYVMSDFIPKHSNQEVEKIRESLVKKEKIQGRRISLQNK